MLDAFLKHPFFLNRYRQAPLLKEREAFLNHLQQGVRYVLVVGCGGNGSAIVAVPASGIACLRAPGRPTSYVAGSRSHFDGQLRSPVDLKSGYTNLWFSQTALTCSGVSTGRGFARVSMRRKK